MTQAIRVFTKQNQIYHGVEGAFSIYNISVAGDQRGGTDVWVQNGFGDDTNILIAGSMVMHFKHYPLPKYMKIKHRHTPFTCFALVDLSAIEW